MTDPFETVPRIGMGCWAIGGPFTAGGVAVGYTGTTDADSRAALEASYEAGVRVFDTAAVYGAGHSETLIGEVLAGRDAVIVSKLGLAFDAARKEMTGERVDPEYVEASVGESRARLRRDRIDVMLLHVNELDLGRAEAVFDRLELLRARGWVGAYGWSTDFPESLRAVAEREGFVAVQHAMNVLLDAPSICAVAEAAGIAQMIRSPLAMGLLTGAYGGGRRLPEGDVRSNSAAWNDWFDGRAPTPAHLARIEALREILMQGGRTLGQGALSWLLARSSRAVPVPGAKTAAQAAENAGAIAAGPLPAAAMAEIEAILRRPPEGPARAR